MKRWLILLIVVFTCLIVAGCNKEDDDDQSTDNNENNQQNYTFKTREEIINYFHTYYVKVETSSTASGVKKYEFAENGNAIYYSDQTNSYLIDKVNNKLYQVNHLGLKKSLIENENVSIASIKNAFSSYVLSHLEIDKKLFIEQTSKSLINGVNCLEYKNSKSYSDSISSLEQYFVAENGGYCVKRYFESNTKSAKVVVQWEMKSVITDSNQVNQLLDGYLNYEDAEYSLEFDTWPETTLGALIPAFTKGSLKVATDNGTLCYIYFENVEENDVYYYTTSIKGYGFTNGKGTTNDIKQYIYIAYDQDYHLVKIKYDTIAKTLSISIRNSTYEEVNNELENL